MSASLPTILIADDEADDQFMLKRALQKAKMENQVMVFDDGEDLMNFLHGTSGACATVNLPAILFLDLNMPRMTGFDVLAALTQGGFTNRVVPIVVSSSDREEDMERAMRLGAVAYHVKFPEPTLLPRILAGALARVRPESQSPPEMSRARA
jgi:two-component system response regulator